MDRNQEKDMRALKTGVFVLLVAQACSDAPPEKERGVSLEDRDLQGRSIEESREGAWTLRRIARGSGGGGALEKSEDPARPEASLLASSAPAPGEDAPATGAPSKRGLMAGVEGEALKEPEGETRDEGLRSDPHGRNLAALPLRAGSTDDNEDFEAYLAFLKERLDGLGELVDHLNVSGRSFIRVLDARGSPVPAARVKVVDPEKDRIVWKGTTYGDGRIPYYPFEAGTSPSGPADLLVEAALGDLSGRTAWSGSGGELELVLDGEVPIPDPVKLDVCFLIDTTGSMADEIQRIKASLLQVTKKLKSLGREFDLRYGAVLYRDLGDVYVTKAHPFTQDLEAFDEALQSIGANGGGDGPESLNQGLAVAVDRMEWREGGARVCFLIADARPHMDYEGDLPYGQSLKLAVAKGIRIHSVAASGLDAAGTMVFRQVAQFTRGKFIFIEYGSTRSSAASHGVTGSVRSNNLDDILFEQIRDEVARWGR